MPGTWQTLLAFSIIISVGLSLPLIIFLSLLWDPIPHCPPSVNRSYFSGVPLLFSRPASHLCLKTGLIIFTLEMRKKEFGNGSDWHDWRVNEWQRWGRIPVAHNFAFRVLLISWERSFCHYWTGNVSICPAHSIIPRQEKKNGCQIMAWACLQFPELKVHPKTSQRNFLQGSHSNYIQSMPLLSFLLSQSTLLTMFLS